MEPFWRKFLEKAYYRSQSRMLASWPFREIGRNFGGGLTYSRTSAETCSVTHLDGVVVVGTEGVLLLSGALVGFKM